MRPSTLLAALGVLYCGVFSIGKVMAVDKVQTVVKAGMQPVNKASATTFTGDVSHVALLPATPDASFNISEVTFQPGARSFWHIHPSGQRLIVTKGTGLTGTADGTVQTISTGDVVECPAGVKHWHGASPTFAMTHIAITPYKDGKNVEWMEEVTDEEYNRK